MKKYFIKETNEEVKLGDCIKVTKETSYEGKTIKNSRVLEVNADVLKDFVKEGLVVEKDVKVEEKIKIEKLKPYDEDSRDSAKDLINYYIDNIFKNYV